MFERFLENYRNVAARHGLKFELKAGTVQVHGTIDGWPVLLYFGTHAVYTASVWRAPAGVEVRVATKGLLAKLADLLGAGHRPLGDPELDKVFAVKAKDAAFVAKLLVPELRAELLRLAADGLHPSIHDRETRIWRFTNSAVWDTEEAIEHDILGATSLARTVSEAFAQTTQHRA